MSELKISDAVVYCPLASCGHYRGKVLGVRPDRSADIELDKDDSGIGETVVLRFIPIVAGLKDLLPGTCARA